MAIPPAQGGAAVQGAPAREPAFNLPALWITADQIDNAKKLGYTVVDPVGILGTHLTEVIRKYAYELFSRQDAKQVVDRVAREQPKLIEDLVPKQLSLATVQKVFQNLLRERVSIKDAVTILEAMGEASALTRNTSLLTEYVRQANRRSIVKPLLNPAGDLPVYFLDSEIERLVESSVEHGEHNSQFNLAPQQIRSIVDRITHTVPDDRFRDCDRDQLRGQTICETNDRKRVAILSRDSEQ